MERRFIEPLEDRRLFAAQPAAVEAPYNPYNEKLQGHFVSQVPLVSVGGTSIKLALRLINQTRERQRGLVDLTFVLDPLPAGRPRTERPVADRFDPILIRQEDVRLNIGPRGSQVFRATGIFPPDLPNADYFVAVAIDMPGELEAGRGYGTSVGAAPTSYIPAFSDVTVGSFQVSLRRVAGEITGSVSGSLRNFGNTAAKGSVTLRLLASQSRQAGASDVLITQQTVEVRNLTTRGRLGFRVPFDSPAGLAPGKYFVRIELGRAQLERDLDGNDNRNVFTRTAITLK